MELDEIGVFWVSYTAFFDLVLPPPDTLLLFIM